MEDFRCNVLIMGKTGTGKSSLLNYLCGQNLAKAGAGKPVTEEGLFEYIVHINSQEVKIFDSWGIEAGKVDRWRLLIDKSLKEHGVQKNMEDWFHSVIYCIQAGGGRVEDVDTDIIKRFLSEGYHLTIVLTKADQVDEDDEEKMKNVILQEIKEAVSAEKQGLLKVFSTCSEEKTTRSGTIHPFGKEEVQKAILKGWKDTIIDRMPKHVIGCLCEEIDDWSEELELEVLNGNFVSGIESQNKDIYKTITQNAKEAIETIKNVRFPEILKTSIESCHKANSSLKNIFYIPIDDKLFDKEIIDNTENSIFDFIRNFLNSLFLLPGIVNLFSNLLKDKIKEQKNQLINYIHSLAGKMKEEMHSLEPKVSKIIEVNLK